MIYLKRHDTPNGFIVAMCDEHLIGKVLKAGDTVLDLDKYASFYKGSLVDAAKIERKDVEYRLYSANAVGEESVGVFIRFGLASKDDVKKIGKVPLLEVFTVD